MNEIRRLNIFNHCQLLIFLYENIKNNILNNITPTGNFVIMPIHIKVLKGEQLTLKYIPVFKIAHI